MTALYPAAVGQSVPSITSKAQLEVLQQSANARIRMLSAHIERGVEHLAYQLTKTALQFWTVERKVRYLNERQGWMYMDPPLVYGEGALPQVKSLEFDVYVVPGSTHSTYRQRKQELALMLMQVGVADAEYVLSTIDDPDSVELLQRMSQLRQAVMANQQAQENLQLMQGELTKAKKQIEKAELDDVVQEHEVVTFKRIIEKLQTEIYRLNREQAQQIEESSDTVASASQPKNGKSSSQ